jgi:threonine synthase
MKATLEFNLPEENQEHLDAVHGGDWRLVVWRYMEHLCRMRKDDKVPTLDALIDDLNEEIEDLNLSLE